MKTLFVLCTAAIAIFPSISVADTLPSDVKFAEDGAVAEPLTDVSGDPENGFKVATTRSLGNCIACHSADGWKEMPLPGNIAPDLTGVGRRFDEARLRGIVTNAKHTFIETMMPSFYNTENIIRPGDGFTGKAATDLTVTILTAQQVEDVVALLQSFVEQ